MKELISHSRLLERLTYDPNSGQFVWLHCLEMGEDFNRTYPGKPAGSIDKHGYLGISVDGRKYQAHRLAWFYMTGTWPKKAVDHRDRVRTNNRIDNLREATRSQNAMNRKLRSDNSTGMVGVSIDGRTGKWTAQIGHKRKVIKLGSFSSPQEASAAYQAKSIELFGDFAPLH